MGASDWKRPRFFTKRNKTAAAPPAYQQAQDLPQIPADTSTQVMTAPDPLPDKEHTRISKGFTELGARFKRKKGTSIEQVKEVPLYERLRTNPTKDEFLDAARDTKVGAVVGTAGMLAMGPIEFPLYAIFRALGQSREEAITNAFQLSFKIATIIIGVAMIVAPAPGTRAAAVFVIPTMLALWKPVNQWTDMDVKQFEVFAKKVESDPELQTKMTEVGADIAGKAANVAIKQYDADQSSLKSLAGVADQARKDPKVMAKIDAIDPGLAQKIASKQALSTEDVASISDLYDADPMVQRQIEDLDPTLANKIKSRPTINPEDIAKISTKVAKETGAATIRNAEKEGISMGPAARQFDSISSRMEKQALSDTTDEEDEEESTSFSAPGRSLAYTTPSTQFSPTPISLSQAPDTVVYGQKVKEDQSEADKTIKSLQAQGLSAGQAKGVKIGAIKLKAQLRTSKSYQQLLSWLEKQRDLTNQEVKDYSKDNAGIVNAQDYQDEINRLQAEANFYDRYALTIRSQVK